MHASRYRILIVIAAVSLNSACGSETVIQQGINSLIKVADEAAGANCVNGGKKIEIGLDNGEAGGTATNGILEQGEVDQTSFICNSGQGTGSLVLVSEEVNGLNCAYGGKKLEVGLDNGDNGGTAGNGLLEAGEVDQTSYVCHGERASGGSSSLITRAKSLGGADDDRSLDMATDKDGNLFMTGYFTGTVDFDITNGIDSHTAKGLTDIFVTKITSDGAYGWIRTIGGASIDEGYAISTDINNNIYIAGNFQGTVDFDFSAGSDIRVANDKDDLFITRINANGSYGWTRTIGGTGDDNIFGLAVDGNNNILVVGFFENTVDFNPAGGGDSRASNGGSDIFVTKMGSDGSYGWTRTFGGINGDIGGAISVDGQGDIFITGLFEDTVDFDASAGTDLHTSNGGRDVFLTKLKSDGSYGWTRTFGGTAADIGLKVAVSGAGDAYVTGYFNDTVDFDFGAGVDRYVSKGLFDVFITRINGDGSYGWTRTFGGSGFDAGVGITAIDYGNSIYVTGYFKETVDFNFTSQADSHTSYGETDIFITELGYDGTYGWTSTFGSANNDTGLAVTSDLYGNIFITGYFQNDIDFEKNWEGHTHSSNGGADIFLLKIFR